MVDYLYDGSFEGFLSCIYAHYYEEKTAGIYSRENYQANLLSGFRVIDTDGEKASRVYQAIETKISRSDLQRIYKVFLSSDSEKENKLLRYIRLGFRKGSAVSLLHSDPVVFDVQKCEQKMTAEIHRILGLARFSAFKTAGREILYCCIEPDHDILEFIAGHFSDRLKCESFIIHDKTRDKAVFSAGGNWYVSDFTGQDILVAGSVENIYRDLWKKYFETIAIKERTNPACQKRFMPVRYWKNLTELR